MVTALADPKVTLILVLNKSLLGSSRAMGSKSPESATSILLFVLVKSAQSAQLSNVTHVPFVENLSCKW